MLDVPHGATRALHAALAAAALLAVGATLPAAAATPAEIVADYARQAGGAPGSAERGQKLFTTSFGTQLGWSCSSCHTRDPTKPGKDDMTGKPIAPMAPAANPERFTDRSKVEHQFRVNCRDVVGRDCTVQEKLDVLSWLLSLRP